MEGFNGNGCSKARSIHPQIVGPCAGDVALFGVRLQHPDDGSDLSLDLSLGARRAARRPARLGHPARHDLRDPHRALLCLAVDGAAALRRRLCVPEPGVRRRDRLLDRDVRIRHLDPAMGRSVRLAALLPRIRLAVSRARGHHGQSGADEYRRLVHDSLGHHHRQYLERAVGDVAAGQRLQELRQIPIRDVVCDAAVVRPHAVSVLHRHAGDLCAEA